MEGQLAEQRKAAAATEAELLRRRRTMEEREQEMLLDMERRLHEKTEAIRAQEAKVAVERARRDAEQGMQEKNRELAEMQARLRGANAKEADLLRRERLVIQREEQNTLEVERRIAEEMQRVRKEQAEAAEQRQARERDERALREEEDRQQKALLEKKIVELEHQLRNGPNHVHGEAQEVLLQSALAQEWPHDAVRDVPKGVAGADVLHTVRGPHGEDSGTIVWESKRTKEWSRAWISKVRRDQTAAGASLAVIVTRALPAGIRGFGSHEGVWVCEWPYAVALGAALRAGLVELSSARRAAEGRGEKTQVMYEYLTGPEFKNRVEGLLDAFRELKHDLESERQATERRWARQDRLLQRASTNVVTFCGDIDGILGARLVGKHRDALASGDEGTPRTPSAKLLPRSSAALVARPPRRRKLAR